MAEAVSSLLPGFVTPTTNSNGAVSGDKRQCEEEAGNPVKKQKTEVAHIINNELIISGYLWYRN